MVKETKEVIMMKRCDVCGKRADGLGTYPTSYGSIVLCSNCYEGSKPLRVIRGIKTLREFDLVKEKLIQEMKSKSFPDHAQQEILTYVEEKRIEVQEAENVRDGIERAKDFPMTTGYNFEGYNITEYLGVISGESVLGTGFLSSWEASFSDMTGSESNAFIDKLKEARQYATERIVIEAVKKGGNAMIGVDIDYTMFSSNMIGVIINATCVIRKKKDE